MYRLNKLRSLTLDFCKDNIELEDVLTACKLPASLRQVSPILFTLSIVQELPFANQLTAIVDLVFLPGYGPR